MTYDREIASVIYRRDLGAFVCAAIPIINPGADFTPSWHIDALTLALQRMTDSDRRNRLVLNLPPRTLKSTIVSVCFVAWLLGQDPSLKIICASYEDSLAKKFSRDTRKLMESPFYRLVFPHTQLNPRKTTETEFETTAHGYRFATSVGGSLTGRGADYLIVDDPIKPQDADSETIRLRSNEWFDNTAMSRQERLGRSKVIVLMQRVHAYDLSGVLMERGWPSIIMQAIAKESRRYPLGGGKYHTQQVDDLLQPARDKLEEYNRLRSENGSRVFEAQYQQNPTPPDGHIIKREWLTRFSPQLTCSSFRRRVLTVDPSGKAGPNNDFTAIAVGGTRDKTMHLLEILRGHWTVMQMAARITETAARWRCDLVIVEDTASGSSLIQYLKAETRLNVIGTHPSIDKEVRLLRQQGTFEARRILLPQEAPWLAEFERELLAFPSGRYDDQVDAVMMLLEWYAEQPREISFVLPDCSRRDSNAWDRFSW